MWRSVLINIVWQSTITHQGPILDYDRTITQHVHILHQILLPFVLECFHLHISLFIIIKSNMETAHKKVNNLINENISPLKVNSFRQNVWYLGITIMLKHTFHIKILQYTCFNWTYNIFSHVKWVWNMSQYNKLFYFEHAIFQILAVHLNFGLFWSHGIFTVIKVLFCSRCWNNLTYLICSWYDFLWSTVGWYHDNACNGLLVSNLFHIYTTSFGRLSYKALSLANFITFED